MNDEDALDLAAYATLIAEAVAKLTERVSQLELTLIANNIHPPMPGYPSPADKEA